VEELQHWVMKLRPNPEDVASVQTLGKTKETEIKALKRRLKIPGIKHVRNPELQAMQAENGANERRDGVAKKKIEILKGGCTSSCALTSVDARDEFSKALLYLDLKKDEIEKLKRTIGTQVQEMKEKDKVIAKYEKLKDKMLIEIEQLKNKLCHKFYLVGARHII